MIPTVDQIEKLLIPRLLDYINQKIAEGEEEITISELLSILNSNFVPFNVDDDITDADIQSILNQTYSPVDDEFNNSDFYFYNDLR